MKPEITVFIGCFLPEKVCAVQRFCFPLLTIIFATIMNKSEIKVMPGYYERYIGLVEEENLFKAFHDSMKPIENCDMQLYNKLGDKVYQPGKWMIKDIYQHMMDTERIFAYRALRFARFDKTALPSYDEELFGKNAMTENRAIEEIVEEFVQLKRSTLLLFKSFNPSVFHNSGIFFDQEMSVLAIGFAIIGHQIHHLNIIRERYEPLLHLTQ